MSIRYIFCINSGRSGSRYLAELLAHAENAIACHEPIPIMNGRPMSAFNEGDESGLSDLLPRKMNEIRRKAKNGRWIYAETNHSFAKGWGWLVPDAYIPQENIGVIVLRRDLEKTAYSLLRTHAVPGGSEWSRSWYLIPGAQRNLSRPAERADLYELCCWSVEETNLRAESYRKRFPRIRYVDCDLDSLNSMAVVLEMFQQLDLIPTAGLRNAVGVTLNKKAEWPALPLEELLRPPRYPSADGFSPSERDALVKEMVKYLRAVRSREVAALRPDTNLAGTLGQAILPIVTGAERELEDRFQTSIMFTETEWIFFSEFLYSLNPKDIVFLWARRHPGPGVNYTYDFNLTWGLGFMLKKFGWSLVPHALRILAGRSWGSDFGYRRESQSGGFEGLRRANPE